MKKLTKALLMAALAFGIVGAAFGIVSVCLGFTVSGFSEAVEEGDFTVVGSGKLSQEVYGFFSDMTADRIDVKQTYRNVESLDLEIGAAQCRIILWDKEIWQVVGCNVPSGFTYRMRGDKLEISCKQSWFSFWKASSDDMILELYIPKDELLDKVEIDAGAGGITVEEGFLHCKKLEVSCGVGECSIYADIEKKAEIEGGVGEVRLTLRGKETDFDYDLECGIGELILGGESFGGIGRSRKIDYDADKEIKVECGVGQVEILFE